MAKNETKRRRNETEGPVLDGDLMTNYSNLVGRIQAMARTYYSANSKARPVAANAGGEEEVFFGLWNKGFSDLQLEHRIRAKLFVFVYRYIIDTYCFGLDDIKPDGLEEALTQLEQVMLAAKGDDIDVSLWRLRTLICLDWLAPRDTRPSPNSRAQVIALGIEAFMAPIFDTNSDKMGLQGQLRSLCQSAYGLTLDLRRSPYKYEVIIPAFGTNFVRNEHEGHGVDGSEDAGFQFEGHPIAIALSGTLVKHAAEGRIVLEKASIIMQRFEE